MGFRSQSGSRRAVAFLVAALVVAAGTGMAAQLGFFTEREPSIRNMKYDGRSHSRASATKQGRAATTIAACRPGLTVTRRAGEASGRKKAS